MNDQPHLNGDLHGNRQVDRQPAESPAAAHRYDAMAQRAADKAESLIHSTRRSADQALDKAEQRATAFAQRAPGALGRVAAQVDDLARRGASRACATRDAVSAGTQRAAEKTVAQIKDQPVRSVLVAAAVGAGLAALLGWVGRGRRAAGAHTVPHAQLRV